MMTFLYLFSSSFLHCIHPVCLFISFFFFFSSFLLRFLVFFDKLVQSASLLLLF